MGPGPKGPSPVTVVATRLVKGGREAEYEAWLERLVRAASVFPGYLGASIHRPDDAKPGEYTSVFRFGSMDSLRRFEESELRRQALAEVVALVEADAVWQRFTGLELWLTPPPGSSARPQPSRFRMALVLIAVVYGLVLSIGRLVALVIGSAPLPVRLLVTITAEVFLMTYVLLPQLTRWLAWWIYPKAGKDIR